ncbi:MAG: hypothetical protein EOM23_07380, partial [Candidatus Moranbacteria bacterium]|nr:hypothetical protein [Candidatus Moranbacteria bacterium]
MKNKAVHHLQPIQTILMVERDYIREIILEDISADLVGEKACGLSSLYESWTPPFIVVSNELSRFYSSGQDINVLRDEWEPNVLIALKRKGINEDDDILIRSNSCTEDMSERGQYVSRQGTVSELFNCLIEYYKELEQLDCSAIDMPVIIQKYIKPLLKGHVSNERRVSQENRDWRCEYESGLDLFCISIRNWRDKTGIEVSKNQPLICPTDNVICDVLKSPCKWATLQHLRVHFEWVYDGYRLYIVQADEEKPSTGIDPTSVVIKAESLPKFNPKILTLLSIENEIKYQNFSKLKNPIIYNKLDMPTAPLYML